MALADDDAGKTGTGNSKAAAVAGTALGAGGAFAIFSLIDFNKIAANAGGTNMGYFYPLAVFSALALLSIVIYSQRVDAPPWKEQVPAIAGTAIFGVSLFLALGVIAFLLVYPVQHCGGGACNGKMDIAARFDDYSEAIAKFSFSQDGLPTGPQVQLSPAIEGDGAAHNFDADGAVKPAFSFVSNPASLTVSVKNLAILKNSYTTLMQNYQGLLAGQQKLAKNCKDQVLEPGTGKLSGICLLQVQAIALSALPND